MTIQEYYEYSWFANLSYVNWNPAAVGLDKDQELAAIQAIADANADDVERVPGTTVQSKGSVSIDYDEQIRTIGRMQIESKERNC
tara:strand:+ start:508 stop:762 length:255 start_codon:yes stop_codon:yes gene_type:complete